jgi:hypothetical protein
MKPVKFKSSSGSTHCAPTLACVTQWERAAGNNLPPPGSIIKPLLFTAMSLSILIATRNSATPFIETIGTKLRPGASLHRYIADEAMAEVQERFVSLAGSNRGTLGHSGFWNRMLSGTTALADESAAIVRMPREVAQRFFGGTIRPSGGKNWLTLPMRSEAYNVSARTLNDLRFVPLGGDRALLVQREQTQFKRVTRGKKKGEINPKSRTHIAGGLAFYLLVKSVTQQGNRDVLPTDAVFAAAAKRGIQSYIASMKGAAA